jgi:DNA repair exonuclease SbcCD ATPase subunit
LNRGNYKKEEIKEKIKEITDNLYSLEEKSKLNTFIFEIKRLIKQFDAYKFVISELVDEKELRRIRIFIFVLTVLYNRLKAAEGDDYLIRIDFNELKKAIRELTDFGDLVEGVRVEVKDLINELESKEFDKVELSIVINNRIRLFEKEKSRLSEKIRKRLENIKERLKKAKEESEYLKLKKELKEVLEESEKIKNLSEEELIAENLKDYLKENFGVDENLIVKYKEEIRNLYNDFYKAGSEKRFFNLLRLKVIKKILKEQGKEDFLNGIKNEALKEVLGL